MTLSQFFFILLLGYSTIFGVLSLADNALQRVDLVCQEGC